MRIGLIYFFLISISSTLFNCNNAGNLESKRAPYTNLSVKKFKRKMKGKDVVVLDVRTPVEAAAGKIENAKVINVLAEDFEQNIKQLDRDKTYLVYCRSGRRSANACNIMANSGFKKLYNLEGGYNAWNVIKP